MDYKLLDNISDISQTFFDRFVMSWDEFQVEMKDFIVRMSSKKHPVDFAFYERSLFWDRMNPKFPYVSMTEALAFLREQTGSVFFMGETGEDGSWKSRRVVDFIAEADAHALAERIEREWYDGCRLAMENMYDPDAILPDDLYVFDPSMKWCIVFTHETTDWESELDDPMKAAESRVCIVCKE